MYTKYFKFNQYNEDAIISPFVFTTWSTSSWPCSALEPSILQQTPDKMGEEKKWEDPGTKWEERGRSRFHTRVLVCVCVCFF